LWRAVSGRRGNRAGKEVAEMMSQAGGMDVNALMQRVRRIATLDTSVFDEVRTDANATIPAVIVAAVATLLFGIGGWLWYLFSDLSDFSAYDGGGEFFLKSVIIGSILAIALWAVWVAITYVLLTQMFRARTDMSELLRVMGFAAAPLGLGVLMFIPMLDFGIALTALALLFGMTLIAVQRATDADAGRALVATAAGFAVWAIVLGLLATDDNVWAPGIFIFDSLKDNFL
jgi:hypothetical protein